MNFENTTVDQVISIFKAGFECLEENNVSPFQKEREGDKILLTQTTNVFKIYLESENKVEYYEDGRFSIELPAKEEINFIQFGAGRKMFNFLEALKRMKEIGLSINLK